MREQKITRRVNTTTIKSSMVELKDGILVETPLHDLTVTGNISMLKAKKLVKTNLSETNKAKTTIIKELKVNDIKYEMSVETFLKNAIVVADVKDSVTVNEDAK